MFISDAAISAFTTLFAILNPVGLIPIFLSLTEKLTPGERRLAALWAAGIAGLILIFFSLLGGAVIDQLGISLPAFRIAGGLMIFYTAFEMVFSGGRQQRQEKSAERASGSEEAKTIATFPLAIPLLAGPGAITACILLEQEAKGNLVAQIELIGVIIIACAGALACFLAAEHVDRFLGKTGKMVLTRLFGVLLAALAVQFVADGIIEFAGAAGGGG